MSGTLRLGHALEGITLGRQNGPGVRAILYVQGCSIRCTPRCLNARLIPPSGGFEYPVAEVARALRWLCEDYPGTGCTILGGEPTDQSDGLVDVLAPLRATGTSIMLYTGHVFEDLRARASPAQRDLLALVDVLVDGPYLEALADPSLVWRGSTNQRILRLSDRYSAEDIERAIAEQQRGVAVHRTAAGVVTAGPQSILAAEALVRGYRIRRPADRRLRGHE